MTSSAEDALAALAVSEQERQQLLASGRWRRRFDKGEVLYRRGAHGDSLHVVAKGSIALRTIIPRGDEVTFMVLGPGDVCGLAAFVGSEERFVDAVALEASETHEIQRSELLALRLTNPSIDDFLLQCIAGQLQRMAGHLFEALYVPADARVLRRLHALAPLYGNDHGSTIVVPLTQDDIANLAGTSRPTTNRVLRAAQEAGAITLKRGRIEIHDLERLAGLIV